MLTKIFLSSLLLLVAVLAVMGFNGSVSVCIRRLTREQFPDVNDQLSIMIAQEVR